MPETARSWRRKPPSRLTRSAQSTVPSADLREALQTWIPPILAGLAALVLYILGLLDVVDTSPALAIDAFLVLAIVLFFPLRYASRLDRRGVALALGFAAVWLAAVYAPIYRRIYPGPRLFAVEATPEALPITLPVAGQGAELDLVIDGHLTSDESRTTRVANYTLSVEVEGAPAETFSGEFKESWLRQRQGRRDAVEVLSERNARTVRLSNPAQADLRVVGLSVNGQASNSLTLSVYRHTLPEVWVQIGVGLCLLFAAVVFDRATGAGETAASMAVSQAVQTSTDNIAAGTLGTPGDNSIALALSQLRTTGVASFGGDTISKAYQRVVSGLGVQVRDAGQKQTAQEVVVSQADGMRKSVSGVSIDEELTTLISQQNAYAAAARLVTVADQMMQDVIAMVR